MSSDMPGYAADGAATVASADVQPASQAADDSAQTASTPGGPELPVPELPAEVAYLPTSSPDIDFPIAAPAGAEKIAGNTPASLQPQQAATAPEIATPTARPQTAETNETGDSGIYATAAETPKSQVQVAPKKKGFFASLFGSAPAQAAPTPVVEVEQPRETVKPVLTLASAKTDEKQLVVDTNEIAHASMNGALPGVRQTALFEIRRKSGIDDESDVDLHEDEGGGLYQVASAAGLARLAPNGLLKQTEGVDVACLKPSLVRVLKMIEGRYGKKMIVTSGYRDPNRNRRARGARNSLHMYCAAADIQIPGVSKWELASYIRSMPGRGGVGTYCHTESIHVDVGPERDWNWRCRRRK